MKFDTPLDPTKIRGIQICVDVDGTLCNETCFTIADVEKSTSNPKMVALTNELYKGNTIVIYTARRDSMIPATLEWLHKNGIKFHSISNNKIPTSMYIDDCAVNAEDAIK